MARATFIIDAIDKTRAVFTQVDSNIKRLSKTTAGLQSQMLGGALGVLGAGSLFVLLGLAQYPDLIFCRMSFTFHGLGPFWGPD
jgi:hypothetical protein